MKIALLLSMMLFGYSSAPAQQQPDLNIEGFSLGMRVETVCSRLRRMALHIVSLSTDTGRKSNGCATFQDGEIDGDQKLSIAIVDGELSSVRSLFPRVAYEQMYNETVKRLGKPTRTGTDEFYGLNGRYGKQRSAEWRFAGSISVTLVDGSATNGDRVGPGFLLLQSDERVNR